ncbi:PadR family transcriptional regulator [Phycicoccus sp. CSK15P-2]|uniref:PadR family transcriptional regulator n=1 Tax=Phycicoccus sp. CSK15P-2 TaxID=2807627 RepID=UPI0019525265|nr:PadR family transcriptional regulator [Phycicoccus sp. CSK15P-2]MBM6402819.1 PadR family transcriptional regulator [Phycicoccus sp. CSK15P-2]
MIVAVVVAREDRESQWLKGVLDLAVLAALVREGSAYGYGLLRSLAEAGLTGLKGGTLYPLLGRLEDDGLVRSEWVTGSSGPPRRYFFVTAAGRAELEAGRAGWGAFAARMSTALEG